MNYLYVSDRRGILARLFPRFELTKLTRKSAFFDGIGVFGVKLYLSGDIPPQTESGRGCFMIARHHPDGSVEITTDPLGMYPLFIYDKDGVFAVSNNVYLLERSLRQLGVELKRSLKVHSYFFTQGSGAFDLTGYVDVQLLPTGGILRIEPRGAANLAIPSPNDIIYSDRPYAELRDEAAHQITSNVRALASHPFDRLSCDLTGGVDSRLVLAALINTGNAGRFVYHTHNAYPNPDANVASLIRKRFGLTKDTGDPAGPLREMAPFERLRYTVGNVAGLFSMDHGGHPRFEKSNSLSIGGGMGELMRQFWSSARAVMKSTRSRAEYLLPNIVDEQLQRLQEFRSASMSAGVQWQHVGDLLYLKARSRYHFGVWWRNSQRDRNRFHPLYSPSAFKAAHALSDHDRKNNRLGYDLMKALSPELLAMPLAEKTWHPSFGHFAEPITNDSPFLGDATRSVSKPKEPNGSSSHIPPGALKRVVLLGEMLADFNREKRDFSALSSVFHVDKIARLMTEDVAMESPRSAWACYRAIGAYVWANRMEIPSL